MSMTREEAIKVLNNFPIDFRNSGGFEAMEALKIAILALRPVSREQVENPVPGKIHGLPPYSQIIQPYMFGEPWLKRTCLWLKGLPCLMATDIVVPEGKWVETTPHGRAAYPGEWAKKGKRGPRDRSKTFPGVAHAMAEQWGRICPPEGEEDT